MAYSDKKVFEMKSCWVYPDGTIQPVSPERHDYEVPDFCKTVENANNLCVKISCCWDYTAPISEIYLPRKLTSYQAKVLVELNDSVIPENVIKKLVTRCWNNHMTWNEVLETI